MQHTINLIDNNEVSVAFTKANASLLHKHKVKDTEELIQLWKQVYKADLVLPDYLIFSNETDLTMFLLKWS